VLANSNDASIGDNIFQPGRYDDGFDVVARLSRFVPIQMTPEVPVEQHQNIIDGAIAEIHFDLCDAKIRFIGVPEYVLDRSKIGVGTEVRKTGRTTDYTRGRVTAINATVDIGFGGGRTARFRDQLIFTDMSAGGDSGSLILDKQRNAVGLLFAGSDVATIGNYFSNVVQELGVELP